jgi:hypothetical protein
MVCFIESNSGVYNLKPRLVLIFILFMSRMPFKEWVGREEFLA